MTKFALYVPLQAKPGKEKEVADFLRSAVPLVKAGDLFAKAPEIHKLEILADKLPK